jgi:hypothetical protein
VALLLAGPACAIVLVVISATTERRWIAVAGYVVLGLTWGVRQAMLVWTYSKTTLQRSAAVLRPASLVLGFVAAAAFDSGWWVLAGLIVSLTILPLADVVERRRSRDSVPEMQTPPSREG